MDTFLFWFGIVANGITVLAGLIAIAGVVWAVLRRAQVDLSAYISPSFVPEITFSVNSVGSNPVRDVQFMLGTLDDNGFSMRGDGARPATELARGHGLQVVGYEKGEHKFSSSPRDTESRWALHPGDGMFLNVTWQSPLFPWRRTSRTFVWKPRQRYAQAAPRLLKGQREAAFLKQTRDPALNPTSPGFVAPVSALPKVLGATDETFDGLIAAHAGSTLVALGATWQGEMWENAKRMLQSLAQEHENVRVIVVDVDLCPVLASRFGTEVLPSFKLLSKGGVVKSHDGLLGLPDLERKLGLESRARRS